MKEPRPQLVWRRSRRTDGVGIHTLAKDMGLPSRGGRARGVFPNQDGDATEAGYAPRNDGDAATIR